MSTYQSKLSFTLKRLKGFLKIFMRNKRGITGVIILVFFSAVALGAPLLTPYDPVHSEVLAGTTSSPSWFRYLPGGERLSENLELLAKPGFPTRQSLLDNQTGWKFTSNTSTAQVSLHYDEAQGHLDNGCAAIVFKHPNVQQYSENATANLYKEFYYPYNGPPMKFKGSIAISVKGTKNASTANIAVPVTVTVFIERIGYIRHDLWSETFKVNTTGWYTTGRIDSNWPDLMDKYRPHDPTTVIFSEPANYAYGVEVLFMNSTSSTTSKQVRTTVYLDDLNLKIYGSTFGLLGTDLYGRDIFSQLVYGARISLFVGLLSAVVGVAIGLAVGLVAGYLGKMVDEVLMRFTDMLLVLPGLPLLLVLVAVLGPSIWNIIFLIGVLGWMSFARVVRSQVLSLKERPFIEAAKAVGAGKFHIILRHILPNVMSLVYVNLALSVPAAILSEAALSWLGLFDPSTMSWGRMLHDAQPYYQKWWWVIPPGLGIALVSLSFILLGYALDEILNPKLRRRR